MRIIFAISLALAVVGFTGTVFYSNTVSANDSQSAAHPEFHGKCALAVADGHMGEAGNAKYSATIAGKTYYFCSQEAKDKFMKDAENNSRSANDRWARSHVDNKN